MDAYLVILEIIERLIKKENERKEKEQKEKEGQEKK